uniref:Integral membrane protein n=1 Tax=uncultured bacterium UPO71 TaxID=1776990 RepID=A0A126SZ21_9BACT|nr:integral membrane protein [uncultured bacterium UPO71]
MRLVQLYRLDVGDLQARFGHAHFEQGEVFGDGEILAIAAVGGQELDRRGPVVALLPVNDVVDEQQLVEEIVHRLQLGFHGLVLVGIDQLAPVAHALHRGGAVAVLDDSQGVCVEGRAVGGRRQQQGCQRQAEPAVSAMAPHGSCAILAVRWRQAVLPDVAAWILQVCGFRGAPDLRACEQIVASGPSRPPVGAAHGRDRNTPDSRHIPTDQTDSPLPGKR